MDHISSFGKAARGLARNPLGIIALFIVLVYALASLVTINSSSFSSLERLPLIVFLVFFPVLVLVVFAWLVTKHPGHLYAPSDFSDDTHYLQAIASLAIAQAGVGGKTEKLVDVRRITETVHGFSSSIERRRSSSREILWVDDRPENNVYLRKAFEELGLEITLALSTNQALELLSRNKYDVIISDMGRKEGATEGYVLLDVIRERRIQTPYFIYAGSNLPEHTALALERGAQGNTNAPQELFEMVLGVLSGE